MGPEYNEDLKGCQGVQRFRFDTGLQCFKYAFLVAAHKPLQEEATKTLLYNYAVNGSPNFPKVDFNCLNDQYPVTLNGITIFERANAHLKIGVTVLQYETEFEGGDRKKGVIFPVRAPSIESVEHWVWLLYKPASDPDSIGHFFPIPKISLVLSEGKGNQRGVTCYYCPTCLSRFRSEIKLNNHMKHCKRHGCQSVQTVSGDRAILRFKNFQNSLQQSDKVALDCEAALIDVYDPLNSNLVKKHEVIAVSYAHAQRDSCNSMQLVEVVERLGGEDCMLSAVTALIKTANKSISRLRNTSYPMTLSPEDELAIKTEKICWVCKGEFVEGNGKEGKGVRGKGVKGWSATTIIWATRLYRD